ncbi:MULTISPECIES: hypothetical protein [unclassified Nocardioides]|uniref:hypothetical protein n=1 Tax=unclassified Nocardioides TaxID=2615069 RepID=UPI0007025EFD|nr:MULTISPECIES: hypothetical protein [unclassified Nocardioides]KQZ74975.1 hypothetical protein ASD66_00920 [Nocardioides sp. Root151]
MSRAHRHPGFPARPLLRPGVRVCRREDGRLQVGLVAHLAVTAPDTEEIRGVLADLRNGVPPGPVAGLSPAVMRFCTDLLAKSLVLDADPFLHALGSAEAPEDRESLSAYLSDTGPEGPDLLDRRRATVVQVADQGSRRAGRRLVELLRTGGVQTTTHPAPGPVDAAVLVARGEPLRSGVDEWIRGDVPHLVVSTSEGVVRVGPFVVPGQTACLRCIDAHHADHDPRRPLILAQYADPAVGTDALPEPIHHDLFEMAILWAARDLLNWVDGRRPLSWGTTVTFDPHLELPRTPWRQHPACGCGWGRSIAAG